MLSVSPIQMKSLYPSSHPLTQKNLGGIYALVEKDKRRIGVIKEPITDRTKSFQGLRSAKIPLSPLMTCDAASCK